MSPKPTADWRDALSALAPSAPAEDHHSDTTQAASVPTKDTDTLTLFYERKGRGGKQATIIAGFTCNDSELKEVASALKQRLATGGSARGGEILIQGDRRTEAAAALRAMGYKVKNG
ncbi:MAG: translation initiation factor [Muribaculaceae bacterium]|jgi:translation initiation factor 1|nr:translation initiation factor [Muribaculaceae bacterium]